MLYFLKVLLTFEINLPTSSVCVCAIRVVRLVEQLVRALTKSVESIGLGWWIQSVEDRENETDYDDESCVKK